MYILKSALIDRCQEMQNIINVSAFIFPFLSLKEPCKVEELDIIISDGNCVREWSYSRVTAQQSSAVTLLIHLVVLESEAHTRGGEAAALCSWAARSTGGSNIGQSPRLL